MKPGWVTNKASADAMRSFKKQNLSRMVPAEMEVHKGLLFAGLRPTRQACWGKKIMDFWFADKAIRVEVDGPTHDRSKDYSVDEWFFRKSGILTLRIPNYNEDSLKAAIRVIKAEKLRWKNRRLLANRVALSREGMLPSALHCYLSSVHGYSYWARTMHMHRCSYNWK